MGINRRGEMNRENEDIPDNIRIEGYNDHIGVGTCNLQMTTAPR